MDFEFSMINRTSMVLISGAISNSLDRYKIRKLEGRPLLLPTHEEARTIKHLQLQIAKREIKRIFKYKTELREACLEQLDKRLRTNLNNLTLEYIRNCILKNDKVNVLVEWSSHSDKNILNRLGLK